jgi:hypothetical protein
VPQQQAQRDVERDNDRRADQEAIHDDTPRAATALQTQFRHRAFSSMLEIGLSV